MIVSTSPFVSFMKYDIVLSRTTSNLSIDFIYPVSQYPRPDSELRGENKHETEAHDDDDVTTL